MTGQRWRELGLLVLGLALVLAVGLSLSGRGGHPAGRGQIWTCSMHPQIRLDHPGLCPICGMELTPLDSGGSGETLPDNQLVMSAGAAEMLDLETVELSRQQLFKELRTVGRVDYDETALTYVTARISGRVEEVFANFPGTSVKAADHLVSIYSPDLLATQAEFLDAARREQELRARPGGSFGSLSGSARRRLELWGVTPAQIDELLRTGTPEDHLVIYAPFGGTIVEKSVRPGQYVETGEVLYRLADLSLVWLILEVFESDVGWVRFGQSVDVTLEGFPEQVMAGSVAFIEPMLNEATRTVRVRVVLPNPAGRLRPGMYAQALLKIPILANGEPGPTGLEGKFVCPMHPNIVRDEPGKCPACRMPLEAMPASTTAPELAQVLAVPADAVLTTGRRQLVYVARGQGRYELVALHLGPRAGEYYPVLHGLEPGDRVVRRGNFLLDSQFQISGKPSLLYPEGMHDGPASGHQRDGATAPPSAAADDTQAVDPRVARNLARLSTADRSLAEAQRTCPITHEPLGSMGVPLKLNLNGTPVFVCCPGCRTEAQERASEIVAELSGDAGGAASPGAAPPAPPADAAPLSPADDDARPLPTTVPHQHPTP